MPIAHSLYYIVFQDTQWYSASLYCILGDPVGILSAYIVFQDTLFYPVSLYCILGSWYSVSLYCILGYPVLSCQLILYSGKPCGILSAYVVFQKTLWYPASLYCILGTLWYPASLYCILGYPSLSCQLILYSRKPCGLSCHSILYSNPVIS